MITGEFRNALDEKGRLLLPARIRAEIPGNLLMLTRAIDNCLWLFPIEEWTRISQNVMENTSPFDPKARLIQRRIIAPAQEVEVDKSGRINVPPTLREVACLKKETIILGIKRYIEIWDESEYRNYWKDKEQEFQEAAAEMGKTISF